MCWLLSVEVLLLVTHVMQDDNEVGDAGAIGLGEGLKSNTSLQTLRLVSCSAFDAIVV
jgi:hypothetical protein